MAGEAAEPARDAKKPSAKPARAAKPAETPKPKEPKKAPPEEIRDELMLKFAGTATLIVGLVLLIAATLAIAALSIMNAFVDRWLIIVPLALIVVGVGAGVAGHYRRVVNAFLHPKPPAPVPSVAPQPYAYPYPYPTPGVAPATPPPATPWPAPPAPGTQARAVPYPYPSGYPYPPAYAYYAPAPRPQARTCAACGRIIPLDSRFCPFCRRALA